LLVHIAQRLLEEVEMQPTTTISGIAIVLAATLGITASATAQPTQVAYAYTPHNDYVVFFDKGINTLPDSAAKTVGMAAHEAGAGHVIKLAGSAGRTAAVKAELIRQGVPASQIEERRAAATGLPTAGDAVSNPMDRRVEITF
jgi:hypothetical protein